VKAAIKQVDVREIGKIRLCFARRNFHWLIAFVMTLFHSTGQAIYTPRKVFAQGQRNGARTGRCQVAG
jgi:hypothetical protein